MAEDTILQKYNNQMADELQFEDVYRYKSIQNVFIKYVVLYWWIQQASRGGGAPNYF